jgi:phage gp29-like protein
MARKGRYNKIVQQGNVNREPVPAGTYSLIVTQTQRGGLDVNDYMEAFKDAENVDYPNRSKLLDIIEEAKTDAHVHAVRQKRMAMILSSPIEFTRDGVVDEKIGAQISSPWFQNLCTEIVEAEEHGNSLVQLRREGEWLDYDSVPRKHYDPVRRIVKTRQTDIEGIPFDEYRDMLLIGDARDLGLLTKAALYVIYKRNAMSDFASFIEKFGRPFIEGEYDGYDEKIRKKLMRDLFTHSGGSVLVRPSGSKILLHDIASKGATSDLHKAFIALCNDEISKLYLGSTLTVEVGDKTGTQALGTVHQAGQDQLGRLSKQRLLHVLNYDLAEIFAGLGLDTRGGEFVFSTPQNKDLSARIQIDQSLFAMGVPFPANYFHETYGVPAPAKGDDVISKTTEPKEDDHADPQDPAPAPPKEEGGEGPGQKVDEKVERTEKKKDRPTKNGLLGWFRSLGRKSDFKARMNDLYRPAVSSAETEIVFDYGVLDAALERIYRGAIDPGNEIETGLFNAFRDILNRAVDEAFPGIKAGDGDFGLYEQLRSSNDVFAAFKTHKMQNEVAAELLDGDGALKSFSEWKRDVQGIVDHHVDHWLRTEYDTAVIRAHHAANWREFERERKVLPRVRWLPSTSVNPRESHRVFWNRIFEMDDPFLNIHRPGNEWGCKCGLEATDEPATDNSKLPTKGGGPSPGLGGNPGITGRIFSDDHPYIANANKGAGKAVGAFIEEHGYFKLHKEYDNGGRISVHTLLDRKKSDYKDVLTVGRRFAEAGHDVQLTPVLHFKDPRYKEIYGPLFGTRYERKCPDLRIDGLFYEFEGYKPPFNKNKVRNMLNHGFNQSSRIIINNNKGAADRYLNRLVYARVKDGIPIDEVWVYEKGNIRLIHKKNRE